MTGRRREEYRGGEKKGRKSGTMRRMALDESREEEKGAQSRRRDDAVQVRVQEEESEFNSASESRVVVEEVRSGVSGHCV